MCEHCTCSETKETPIENPDELAQNAKNFDSLIKWFVIGFILAPIGVLICHHYHLFF